MHNVTRKKRDIRKSLHYPHGSIIEGAQNEYPSIVLGTKYDSRVFRVCPTAIKCNIKNDYKDMMNLFQEQLMDANVIIIFGHSMGETDSQYFKDVLKTSSKLDVVLNINYSDSKCNEVSIKLDDISENTFMSKVQEGKVHYITFSTQGFVDKYYIVDEKKEAELSSLLKYCFTYNIGHSMDL